MNDRISQEEILKTLVNALDGKKAEDVRVIKIKDLTIIADYFVIAGGSSDVHTRALADEAEFKLKERNVAPLRIQGNNGGGWIVLDYGDIVVHVFRKDQRDFYSLERLWSDGENIDISKWTK